MLCAVPDGEAFKVQVKGISTPNAFYIDKAFFEGEQPDLFLVIVLVPYSHDEPPHFFVLSHAQAKEEFAKMPPRKRDGSPIKASGPGLNWGSIKEYKGKWTTFPKRVEKGVAL
jgi:hypothetical protein